MVHNLVHNLCESLMENIGGIADTGKRTPPIPITYLTQWKIVGNSEVHGQEIWSCGEYNATDGKYHILAQPQGGSIADIALTEPLRKVNDVADTIEFPSDTVGKALVTRPFGSIDLGSLTYSQGSTTGEPDRYRYFSSVISDIKNPTSSTIIANILCTKYTAQNGYSTSRQNVGISVNSGTDRRIAIYDAIYNAANQGTELKRSLQDVELIYELDTPTTELVDAPQIAEADSYSCEISQGAKAVSWSRFETN